MLSELKKSKYVICKIFKENLQKLANVACRFGALHMESKTFLGSTMYRVFAKNEIRA